MSNLTLSRFTAYGWNSQLVLSLNLEILLLENAPIQLTKLHVSKEYEYYVADICAILARVYTYRNAGRKIFLIYSGKAPVGMVLYYNLKK